MNRKKRRFLKSKTPEPTSSVPQIDYAKVMAKALEGVIKEILHETCNFQNNIDAIKEEAKKDDNALYFRIRIDRDDVIIPKTMREYSEANNIKYFDFILDRWFKHLNINEDFFEVEILFDSVVWDKIRIPYSAISFIKNEKRHFNLNLEPYIPNLKDEHNHD